jgi:hypothetical protein
LNKIFLTCYKIFLLIFFQSLKKGFAEKWIEMEDIVLSESNTDKYYVFSFICGKRGRTGGGGRGEGR